MLKPTPPRPVLMRNVQGEPLTISRQMANLGRGTELTESQKSQLCTLAYGMIYKNQKAKLIRSHRSKRA